MQPLDALVQQAASLAAGAQAHRDDAVADAARMLQICNACRYCDGYCAMFPAMTRRLEFSRADVHYLANLCHSCGACLHACQYAPPHEFGVNVPRAMARVRAQTWAEHAWPAPLGALYRRNGLVVALALAAALALFLVLAVLSQGSGLRAGTAGDFYRVLPHGLMVALFGPLFVFVVTALAIGVRRFFKGLHGGAIPTEPAHEAAHDVLTLKYLDGGHGEGCNEVDDAFTLTRRRAHHLVFYGFVLCFAATCVATVYHYAFGLVAPYGWTTLPKLLGTSGGLALAVGSAWLWVLHARRHPLHNEPSLAGMDRGFIALLFLTAAGGLVLALARTTAAMPLLLALHLASVMALFATLPYGKFAHGVYRAAALLKWAIERRQPARLDVGEG
ncbi:MAG TPA: tricarballylate utilization 4Fe-4S protein TcuB [Burkholderiaceae bacterium]|nr:tricarballylate utilization 4Fe-4S protein TcuB [Burkholderiaceae bacterium]